MLQIVLFLEGLHCGTSMLKAVSKFVADDILKYILLFFRDIENKMTFHVNHLLGR